MGSQVREGLCGGWEWVGVNDMHEVHGLDVFKVAK